VYRRKSLDDFLGAVGRTRSDEGVGEEKMFVLLCELEEWWERVQFLVSCLDGVDALTANKINRRKHYWRLGLASK